MRTPLATVLLLVVLAGGAQGLTLLQAPGEDASTMRVRIDAPPLQAHAQEGNLTLEDQPLGPQPEPVDVEVATWRGFANVTQLNVGGTGWLALADDASGLLVHLEDPDPDRDASETGSNTSEERSARADDAGIEGKGPGEASPAQDEAASAPRSSGPSQPREQADASEDAASDDATGLPVDPATVALGLLVAGGFAIDRFARRGGGDEDAGREDPR